MDLLSKSSLNYQLIPDVLEYVDWFHKTLTWHKVPIGVRACDIGAVSKCPLSLPHFFPSSVLPSLLPSLPHSLCLPPPFPPQCRRYGSIPSQGARSRLPQLKVLHAATWDPVQPTYKYIYLKKINFFPIASSIFFSFPSFTHCHPVVFFLFFFWSFIHLLFRPRLLPKRMRSHLFPYSIFWPFFFFLSFPNHFPFQKDNVRIIKACWFLNISLKLPSTK